MGNKNSGRRKGVKNKDGYTMSERALSVRKMAALQHGGRSSIIKKYVTGEKSPVPVIKDEDIQALRKELYIHYLVNMSEPTAILADILSNLLVEVDLAKIKGDHEGEVLSNKTLRAAKIAGELANNIHKMKTGNKQTIEVLHKDFFNDNQVVNMEETREGTYEERRVKE